MHVAFDKLRRLLCMELKEEAELVQREAREIGRDLSC